MNTERLRVVANCVRRFGPFHGLKIGAQLMLRKGEFEVRPPAYQHPVHVRSGTSDPIVFEKIFASREYDSPAKNPATIIDLGANVGYASVFFAEMFPDSQIIAVEPDASNFAQLQKNIAPYPNITGLQRAVWPRHEAIKIGDLTQEKWLFQIEQAAEGESGDVRPITMPDLLEKMGNRPIDILKIDIESAEKPLFSEGTDQWLPHVKLLIIELHDNLMEGCSKTVYEALVQHDFNQWINGENLFITFEG